MNLGRSWHCDYSPSQSSLLVFEVCCNEKERKDGSDGRAIGLSAEREPTAVVDPIQLPTHISHLLVRPLPYNLIMASGFGYNGGEWLDLIWY